MCPGLPLDPPDIYQAQVGLIYERGRLKQVSGTFGRHMALRHSFELGVDARQEYFCGRRIPDPPLQKQRRHVIGPHVGHRVSLKPCFSVASWLRNGAHSTPPPVGPDSSPCPDPTPPGHPADGGAGFRGSGGPFSDG
jgi:hypothetical protein